MAKVTQLETSRLLLRHLRLEDAETMFSTWCSDPEVTALVTWIPHKDIEDTKAILSEWVAAYEDPKTVRFGLTLKETGELIGEIDVIRFHGDKPEIGFCLSRKYWGKGYMTEAVRAMIRHLFHLGYNEILVCTHEENIGSIRVIERCHFRFIKKEFKAQWSQYKLDTVTLNWYHLLKDE